MSNRPIGFFDSGEGGLTVARAVADLLPAENILYACDSAHFPYGPRALGQVRAFFSRFAAFFAERGCKLAVVACNTATAAALLSEPPLDLPVPALGVVEPGARAAAAQSRSGQIGVVATQATCRSGVYMEAIRQARPDARVYQQPCPVLVSLAEDGEIESPTVRMEVECCLAPVLSAGIDTLVLGCTHLPHMERIIAEVAGPGVTLVDPGRATALEVREWLARRGLLHTGPGEGRREFFCTGDPERFSRVARQLWPQVGPTARQLFLDLCGATPAECMQE